MDFSGLLQEVAKPMRCELVSTVTNKPIIDKNGQPMFLELLSGDSAAGLEFDDRINDRNSLQSMNGTSFIESKNARADVIGRVIALVRGWHLVNVETLEPIEAPFTPKLAAELLSEPGAMWMIVQAHNFLRNRANFFPPKSISSSPGPNTTSN